MSVCLSVLRGGGIVVARTLCLRIANLICCRSYSIHYRYLHCTLPFITGNEIYYRKWNLLQEMKYIRDALLPVLMSCATSAGNVKTLEELLNQVSYWRLNSGAFIGFLNVTWHLALKTRMGKGTKYCNWINYKESTSALAGFRAGPVFSIGDKRVEALGCKIRFSSAFSPFPPKQCWFFYFFLDCTDHSAYTKLNSEDGGIRELTLDWKKQLKKCLNIEKGHFLNEFRLEMLVFAERGKPERTNNKVNSAPSWNWTSATLVGGERSHRCAISVFHLCGLLPSLHERVGLTEFLRFGSQ